MIYGNTAAIKAERWLGVSARSANNSIRSGEISRNPLSAVSCGLGAALGGIFTFLLFQEHFRKMHPAISPIVLRSFMSFKVGKFVAGYTNPIDAHDD